MNVNRTEGVEVGVGVAPPLLGRGAQRRPISHRASAKNRARWERLEAAGWVPLGRGGTGSWVHPDLPHMHATTAGALRIDKERNER